MIKKIKIIITIIIIIPVMMIITDGRLPVYRRCAITISYLIILSAVDVADVDINSDGVVDQVELGKYLDTRDAADFLTLADTDGRHVMYLECLATQLMTSCLDFTFNNPVND